MEGNKDSEGKISFGINDSVVEEASQLMDSEIEAKAPVRLVNSDASNHKGGQSLANRVSSKQSR